MFTTPSLGLGLVWEELFILKCESHRALSSLSARVVAKWCDGAASGTLDTPHHENWQTLEKHSSALSADNCCSLNFKINALIQNTRCYPYPYYSESEIMWLKDKNNEDYYNNKVRGEVGC